MLILLKLIMRGKIHNLIVFSAFHKDLCQIILFEVFCGNAIKGRPKSAHGCVREMGVISALWQEHCSETISSRVTTAHTVELASQTLQCAVSFLTNNTSIQSPKQAVFKFTWAMLALVVSLDYWQKCFSCFISYNTLSKILTTVNSFPVKHC